MRTYKSSTAGGTRTMRILIADDHEISRVACRALLRAEGVDVVADLAVTEETLAAARDLHPDIAIVDVTPAAEVGFGIARALRDLPSPPLVVLTSTAKGGELGPGINNYPFIAKADICAAAIARAASAIQAGPPESQDRFPGEALQPDDRVRNDLSA